MCKFTVDAELAALFAINTQLAEWKVHFSLAFEPELA